ncbi:hypothetical protein BAR24_10935 [Gluconobacter oxydans]|uniref:biotin/lipoyl-containing protein n=1 Tax=Gluconobacter thailandicus TaxID=257438 RepID=UPI0002998970|nr:biotin/lipoyl-containing protein [Gluconobacter thailandicus]AFW02592.1 hypothetical protein B932_3047 [Gluconobacter oxydans H24]ANQ41923.1 hypothetical protein BAR24_10935 [Gluconobacter oxydans]
MISPETLDALVGRMRQYGVTTFEQQSGGTSLHLTLAPAGAGQSSYSPSSEPSAVSGPCAPDAHLTLRSPELGIFRPGSLRSGDTVRAGDILAFTEVGPLRLPVVAPEDGTLVEILMQNGQTAGYHAPVMILQSG